MVQMPILRPKTTKHTKVFGASLFELQEKGLLEDGVPVVLKRMVEHLRKHGESQHAQSVCKPNLVKYTDLMSLQPCCSSLGVDSEF